MMALTLPHDLEDQLRQIAEREQRSPEEVLRTALSRYDEADSAPTLAQLAESLAAADFHSGQTDTATRSRDILDAEYGDYLARRMNRPTDGSA
jgi:predicted transcriptional regulator